MHRPQGGLPQALLLLCAVLPSPAFGAMCEAPGELYAAELVEPALLSSALHTVRPCAEVRGHMAHFELDTPLGMIEADSVELLQIRVEELPALESISERTRTGVALQAAAERGGETVRGVARVAMNPFDTLKSVPAGALRFFERRVDKYRERARRLGERAADEATDRDEAYDRASVRPGVVEPRSGESRTWWRRAGREIARFAKGELGYGKARRKWARRLGIDPYTTNPLLNERMDELGWAALAGEKLTDTALGAVGGAGASALSHSRTLNDWVWELDPDALAERNRQRLLALGCGGKVEVRRFLRNGRFKPATQTALVDALVELQPAGGCVDVIELAAALGNEIEARYLVAVLRMAAAVGSDHERGALQLRLVGTTVVLRANITMRLREGVADETSLALPRDPRARERLVMPLAVDYLQWTPTTAAFFDSPEWRVADKLVLVAGHASPKARRGLARRGFSVVERYPFDGAAPYRTR